MSEGMVSVELGRIHWGAFRDYLEDKKFCGAVIAWREGRGWFSREFTIRGNSADIAHIRQDVGRFIAELNKADPES